jgi:flagellar basal-body rod modification protein FlgD
MNPIQSQPVSNLFGAKNTAATNGSAATGSTSATTNKADTKTDTKAMSSDFMTMLIAQMQYQDPTKPVDSAQMTSQLAQISTVEGVNKLNDTMNALASSLKGNQAFQAANMIGHNVLVPGNNASLSQGQAAFGIQLPVKADSVNVSILNDSGQTIKVLGLGPQAAGNVPVSWDGKDASGNAMPSGNYRFQVTAASAGQPVNATTLQKATVTSVSNTSGGVMLNLNNNNSVNASSVQQIL